MVWELHPAPMMEMARLGVNVADVVGAVEAPGIGRKTAELLSALVTTLVHQQLGSYLLMADTKLCGMLPHEIPLDHPFPGSTMATRPKP
jgi:hypothetical protein